MIHMPGIILSLPQLAAREGVRAADYAAWCERLPTRAGVRLCTIEDRGWRIPAVEITDSRLRAKGGG